MNIEQIKCTSLELSKQLKEAGYKQEGLWWWTYYHPSYQSWFIKSEKELSNYIDKHSVKYPKGRVTYFVAPTVAELGEALPDKVSSQKGIIKECKWICESFIATSLGQAGNTEADARAKMWLHLKKEGLLK